MRIFGSGFQRGHLSLSDRKLSKFETDNDTENFSGFKRF